MNLITFLKKPKHYLDKQKGLYSPIVKFIDFLPFDTATIDEAYSKYKTFLDTLANMLSLLKVMMKIIKIIIM